MEQLPARQDKKAGPTNIYYSNDINIRILSAHVKKKKARLVKPFEKQVLSI